MRTFCLFIFLLICQFAFSQDMKAKLGAAISKLEGDEQFKHAIVSMYVVDGKTGKVLYDKNGQVGLAPASCQKVVTSVSAFEMLGKDFTYQTQFGYSGTVYNDSLNGHLYVIGNGDPTFGSWRWQSTNEASVVKKMEEGLKKLNIRKAVNFIINNTNWESSTIPDGWTWEDIGQYYGAGSSSFNWNENQYDILLQPGAKVGDPVKLLSSGYFPTFKLVNELTTGAKGTGDQVYVYMGEFNIFSYLRGTAPMGIDTLKVTASTDATDLFINTVVLKKLAPVLSLEVSPPQNRLRNFLADHNYGSNMQALICSFTSPDLDSMNYWFLKKSINLYGEAFVKTIAYEKTKIGSTDSGVNVIRDFWADKGIDRSALKIIDGSGLSPANRLTTNALVTILQYAKQRPWFASFYNALPEMNGIKMKDGYIGGVRSYTGYVRSASGAEYSFSFIVNNFDGSPASAKEKIWKVLDLLK